MTELVTKTPHDDLSIDQRRTLARFEAAAPAPESFDGAARIISRRSQLLKRLSGQGAMLSVDVGLSQAEAIVADTYDHRLRTVTR